MLKFLQGCLVGFLCFTIPLLIYVYKTGGF